MFLQIMALLARILLSVYFVVSGTLKLTMPTAAIASIARLHLPLPAQLAWLVAVLLELGGGLCVLLGYRTRPAAIALGSFCIVTGLLVHYHPGNAEQMADFMRYLAMAGGFLQLAVTGPGRFVLAGGRKAGW